MSIASETARVQYTLSGAGQTLAVPFYFLASSDLLVTRTVAGDDTTLVLNTDYTVAGAGNPAGGSITLTAGTAGDVVTISQAVAFTQDTELTYQGQQPAKVLERAYDRLALQVHRLSLAVKRSLRLPVSNAEAAELTLNARKGAIPYFDPTTGALGVTTRQSIVNDGAAASIASAAAAAASEAAAAGSATAAAASQVAAGNSATAAAGSASAAASSQVAAAASAAAAASYQAKIEVATVAALKGLSVASFQSGDVAVVRGYYAAGDIGGGAWYYDSASAATDDGGAIIAPNAGAGRWRILDNSGEVNAARWGLVNDGATDSSARLQAAVNYAATIGRPVYVPPGNYKVGNIDLNNVSIRGAGYTTVFIGKVQCDVFLWREPQVAGYQRPVLSYIKDMLIRVDATVDDSANLNRIGFGGERVGRCGIVWPDPAGAFPYYSIAQCVENVRFESINNGLTFCNVGCIFTDVVMYRWRLRNVECQAGFDYGIVMGLAGARPCTLDGTANTVTRNAHGLANNTQVALIPKCHEYGAAAAVLPTGLAARTRYYVVNATTNTFQLSLTSGGSAIDFGTDGSGTFFFGKAGTSFVEYAPDEMTWINVAMTTSKASIVVCDAVQSTFTTCANYAFASAFKLLNYPTVARQYGDENTFSQFYTEAQGAMDIPHEYARWEWQNSRATGFQLAQSAGNATINLAGIGNDWDMGIFRSSNAIVITGHRNKLRVWPDSESYASPVDRGGGNVVEYRGRWGGGMLPSAPQLTSKRNRPDFGRFAPDWLFTNPSSKYLSREALFIPGSSLQPYGFADATYAHLFDDDTLEVPGYLRAPSMAGWYSLTWCGRNTQTHAVDDMIPRGRGTVYVKMRGTGAATVTLNMATFGGSGVTGTNVNAAVTTSWQTFAMRYDTTGASAGAIPFVNFNIPSASIDLHVAWICWVPDQETVRTQQLWLADGVTAPASNVAGMAQLYIDSADGDLKIRFADGTVKTIVVDT